MDAQAKRGLLHLSLDAFLKTHSMKALEKSLLQYLLVQRCLTHHLI